MQRGADNWIFLKANSLGQILAVLLRMANDNRGVRRVCGKNDVFQTPPSQFLLKIGKYQSQKVSVIFHCRVMTEDLCIS
jgi:hypothetical protein